MKNILIITLFLSFIACVSYEQGNQREYNVVLKRRLKDTISVIYKLDSSYEEVNAGLELWNTETARKYEKKHEVIIEFYHYTDSYTEKFVKIGAGKRVQMHNNGDNPFSVIEGYATTFNSQKGYFIKSKRTFKDSFILSYCTINEGCQTAIRVSMLGDNLSGEDESAFQLLIGSFIFQKH